MYKCDAKSFHSQNDSKSLAHREAVDKAVEYIRKNYRSQISLDSIVADMYFSKGYFRQLFRSIIGMPVTDYIQKIRIDEAIRLIQTTERTIFDIAGDCGFADVKFFYKTFKKITGKTPKEYRQYSTKTKEMAQ